MGARCHARSGLPVPHGFTLLELLLALSIFALVSAMSFSGLRAVLEADDVTRSGAERLARLQTAMVTVQRDVEQAVPRPVRDELGGTLPAWQGGAGNQPMLELTRDGWPNPRGEPVSSLRRVAYTLEDRVLVRLAWPVLDRSPDTVFVRYPLLDQVDSLQLRFLDEQGVWQTSWPPAGIAEPAVSLPLALEFVVELEDVGVLHRVFRVRG